MKQTLLALLFGALTAWGAADPQPCVEKTNSTDDSTFQLGLSTAWLVPNNVPLFDEPIIFYGPVVSLPLGPHALQVQFFYGSTREDWSLFSEGAFRFHIPTPFVRPFLTGGVAYLYYNTPNDSRAQFGGQLGLGLKVAAGDSLDLQFALKNYFFSASIFSIGASIMFHL